MTQRPGREARSIQHRTRRALYFGSRSIDQLLFLVVVTLFAVAAVGHIFPASILFTWLATVVAVAGVQLKLSTALATQGLDDKGVAGTAEVMLACLIATALTWGLVGVYAVTKGEIGEQMLMVALISSLVIYALTHSSAIFGAFALYVFVLAAPAATVLIISSDLLTRTLGAAFVVLVTAGLVGGWRHYQVVCRTVRLEVEVEEQSGVLNQLNTRLEAVEDSAN